MIDFVEMEKVIQGLKTGFKFVNCSELITMDDIKKIIELKDKYSMSYVRQCIEKNPVGNKKGFIKFSVERACYDCGKIGVYDISKTELEDIIQQIGKHYRCKDCEKKLKEKKAAEKELKKQNDICRTRYTTGLFISGYLDPNATWNIPPKNWFRVMCNDYFGVDREAVANYIKNMPYSEFLKTPYWKAVAMQKKYRSGFKCQVCNSTELLNVHHRSYEHHGMEINFLEDLIVLCKNCHSTFHETEKGV